MLLSLAATGMCIKLKESEFIKKNYKLFQLKKGGDILKKPLSLFITGILTLLIITNAAGQTTPPAGQNDTEAERIQAISTMLNETRFSNSLWWYGWMGVYGASAGVSFSIAGKTDSDTVKITQTVSGIESVIGFAGVLLSPMPPAYAAGRLENMPDSTADEQSAKLAAAEGYLKETAETQEFGRSWVTHTLNFVVNASGGLAIWKGYDEEIEKDGGDPLREGLINFIVGFVVGEIQIFTQPTKGIEQWKSYRGRYGIKEGELENNVKVFAVAVDGGLAAGLTLKF